MRGRMSEQDQAAIGDAVARMAELAAEGDLTAAVRAFAGGPFDDEEIAVAEDAGYFEAAGRYVPHLLNLLRQGVAYEGPTAEDPAVLGAISAPVPVLHGSGTRPLYPVIARYVTGHVPHAQVREIPAPVTPPRSPIPRRSPRSSPRSSPPRGGPGDRGPRHRGGTTSRLLRPRSAGGLAEPAGEVAVQVPLIVADPGDVAVGA